MQDISMIPSKKISPWLSFERNEILLYLIYFMYGIAFANYEPYAPVWLGQFFAADKSYLIIGFIVIIPCLTRLVGSPFWGVLADKYGAKKFVIIGFAGYSLMFFSLIFTWLGTTAASFSQSLDSITQPLSGRSMRASSGNPFNNSDSAKFAVGETKTIASACLLD